MGIKRDYRHKNPKLRMLTILKIQRLERKIAALIASDEELYDAGLGRNRRGVVLNRENDRRTTEFKLRAKREAEQRAAQAAAVQYGSDGPAVPANWRNQPVGGSFRCIWKLDRCRAYFNPAAWSLAEQADGYTLVTRIGADAHQPAEPPTYAELHEAAEDQARADTAAPSP